jgi:hypothetical protein
MTGITTRPSSTVDAGILRWYRVRDQIISTTPERERKLAEAERVARKGLRAWKRGQRP